jgi:hypothetical protein
LPVLQDSLTDGHHPDSRLDPDFILCIALHEKHTSRLNVTGFIWLGIRRKAFWGIFLLFLPAEIKE